jgi:hypothetical protein
MFGVCRHFSGQGINYQDVLEAQFTLDGGLTLVNLAAAFAARYVFDFGSVDWSHTVHVFLVRVAGRCSRDPAADA